MPRKESAEVVRLRRELAEAQTTIASFEAEKKGRINSMITAMNDKPVKGAQCVNCKNELDSVRCEPGEMKMPRLSTDRQVLYFCKNPNCTKYGLVTAVFWHGSAPQVEVKTTEPLEPVIAA